MPSIPKSITRSDFKFDLSQTLCGSVAYTFYNKDSYVMNNNNYYPTAKAIADENVMFKELVRMIVKEENFSIRSEVEKNFLKSEDYIKLKKMLDV